MQPLFVVQGLRQKEPIFGLTDVYRDTDETVLGQIESDLEKGISSFILFGVPNKKSKNQFSAQWTSEIVRKIKTRFGDEIFLAVDVCVCSHTEHGHCGILNAEGTHVENESTVQELARLAVEYAKAGADCVAPSDMMDGRIQAIRRMLEEAGLVNTLIMSYSAKFHSAFYGPFRLAADSAPKVGAAKLRDRATYQIDPSRRKDAILCSERDFREGADILMVKPGMPYLDVLKELSERILAPWAIYQVSGEFAALELMSEKGLIHREKAHLEAWTSFVRAGAQIIITYGARQARDWLKQ
jgi:porphobilinogen synthase